MEGRRGARPYRVRFRNSTCPTTSVTGADYKKYDFFFDPKQVWLKTRRSRMFTFHDQSRSIYYDANNAEDDSESDTFHDRGGLRTASIQDLLNPESHIPDGVRSGGEPTPLILPRSPESTPIGASITASTLTVNGTTARERSADVNPNHACCTHVEDPYDGFYCDVSISRFPSSCHFDNTKEASLFRHYVENLARWFDVCNPYRPFAYAVPRLAASSPLLRKAILAHSAHHISRITGFDQSLPFQYLEDCLALLIPKLKEGQVKSMDDSDLIATIFLRSFGEFEDIASGEFHISGTSLFIQSGGEFEPSRRSNNLRNAVYWIYLRQEISYSLVEQRNIRANLNICPYDTSTDASSDAGWCNRVVWISVQVLRWAFGGNGSVERWTELSDMIEEWETRRPKSFEPMLDLRGPFDSLEWDREVWFTNDEHIDALQYLLIAKLILSIHDPNLPKLGHRAMTAASNQKAKNQFYVRTICTAAKCSSFLPAKFTACNVLFATGACFHLEDDRDNVISFLRSCEREHGYSTQAHVEALLKIWAANYQ